MGQDVFELGYHIIKNRKPQLEAILSQALTLFLSCFKYKHTNVSSGPHRWTLTSTMPWLMVPYGLRRTNNKLMTITIAMATATTSSPTIAPRLNVSKTSGCCDRKQWGIEFHIQYNTITKSAPKGT